MIEQIEKNLLRASYKKISVNVKTIQVYLSRNGDRAQVIILFHKKEEILLEEQYKHILEQIRYFLETKGYSQLHIHSIIYTDRINEIQNIIQNVSNCWVIDAKERKLYIYENQPSDFYGIKGIIEAALEGNFQSGNKKRRKVKAPVVRNNGKLKYIWRQYPVFTWFLVAVNIILFLVMEMRGSTEDTDYMLKWGAMYVPYVLENGQYYRLFTHMFLHFGFDHLLNNMLILFLLGGYAERHIGKIRFLITYLTTGILAGFVSMEYNIFTESIPVSAGASGAIFGIIGALFYIILIHKGRLEDLSIGRMAIFIFLSLYSGIAQIDVDNAAHVGGFLCGIIVAAIIYPYKKSRKGRVY